MRKRISIALLVLLSCLLASMLAAGLSAIEEMEILAAQNRYRAELNVASLNWSDNLSSQAQKCADYNAANFLPTGRQKHVALRDSGRTSP